MNTASLIQRKNVIKKKKKKDSKCQWPQNARGGLTQPKHLSTKNSTYCLMNARSSNPQHKRQES